MIDRFGVTAVSLRLLAGTAVADEPATPIKIPSHIETFLSWLPTDTETLIVATPGAEIKKPLRMKPLTQAPPLLDIDAQSILQPLTIEGHWMEVKILDHYHQEIGKGWLRWRSNTELLITYDLLT